MDSCSEGAPDGAGVLSFVIISWALPDRWEGGKSVMMLLPSGHCVAC